MSNRKHKPQVSECVHGHPFDESNTRLSVSRGRVYRHCKACEIARLKIKRDRQERERVTRKTLVEVLAAGGVESKEEVITRYGIADVVTATHVYEVKRLLNMRAICTGLGQALLFARDLKRKPVLVGPWHRDVKKVRGLLMKRWGVEIQCVDRPYLSPETLPTKNV